MFSSDPVRQDLSGKFVVSGSTRQGSKMTGLFHPYTSIRKNIFDEIDVLRIFMFIFLDLGTKVAYYCDLLCLDIWQRSRVVKEKS